MPEKPGLLLPPRPSDAITRRRPANEYLPSWIHSNPAALDFAVTSPQRQDIVPEASSTPRAAAVEYVGAKEARLNIADLNEFGIHPRGGRDVGSMRAGRQTDLGQARASSCKD